MELAAKMDLCHSQWRWMGSEEWVSEGGGGWGEGGEGVIYSTKVGRGRELQPLTPVVMSQPPPPHHHHRHGDRYTVCPLKAAWRHYGYVCHSERGC